MAVSTTVSAVQMNLSELQELESNQVGSPIAAVCKDPAGHAFGFIEGKEQFKKDGIRGGQVVLSYDGGQSGTVVTQGAGGGTLVSGEALLMDAFATQVSFYVAYQEVIVIHTIFRAPSKMLLTQHVSRPDLINDGAWERLFIADCDISLN